MATLTVKVLMTPRPQLLSASVLLIAALALPARGQYLETVISLGHGAQDILWNPTSNKVYTANYDNTVSIINGATNEVITTLATPEGPFEPAWNSVTNKVYVVCSDANRVVAIDGQTDAITANVALPGWPGPAAYSAASNKLYVSLDDGRVSVIDGNADTLIRTVRVQSYGGLLLLWHPLTNRVFCSTDCDTIAVLDCASDQVLSKIPTGFGGGGFIWDRCYNPVNGFAYFGGAGGVLALTAEGDSIITRVPGYVYGLCAVPFPNKLYLDGWHLDDQVGVLDCNTNTVSDSIMLCAGPMACDTVQGKVYVSYVSTSDSLGVVDARTDSVILSMPCPAAPRNGVCWNSTNSRAYFATQDTFIYVVRDTTTGIAEQPTPETRIASMLASPNPFIASVELSGGSKSEPPAELCVYSRTGERVALLHPAETRAGRWRCAWDGRDDLGRAVPAGVYFVRSAGLVTRSVVKTTSSH